MIEIMQALHILVTTLTITLGIALGIVGAFGVFLVGLSLFFRRFILQSVRTFMHEVKARSEG